MAEIGATLREARMRAGIDIGEVEARTKIRAKYLRALENEEWDLLPGPTFVKSFLRTYAETLGLDAKLLVEEYKFRHDPYETTGLPRRGGRGRRGSGGGAFGPPKRTNWLPIVALVLLVVAALYVVGRISSGEDEAPPPTTTIATTTTEDAAAAARREERRREAERRRSLVKLRVSVPASASAAVYVCVRDARDRAVIRGQELQPGRRSRLVRSQRFRVVLSDAGARVTDGGRRLPLRAGDDGVVAYEIAHDGRRVLPRDRRPSCS
ncbi:MAG: helix-turn-helix domain-containing protein [Solirubrobacteraceae bacterium]|nr:helix-turn-helix domain-containing protein [Solirubrobacteraceae bacterium]